MQNIDIEICTAQLRSNHGKNSVLYSTATNLVAMFKEQCILQYSYLSCWYV